MKRNVILILTVLALTVALLVPATQVSAEPQSGGTLRFGILRDPEGFDPHINYGTTSTAVQGNIYDTLIEYDETGEFRGALATDWEMEGDQTYIFHLREGVEFHDGTPFTSEDVIASLDRIKDPETNAARHGRIAGLFNYEAVDDYTVRIVLREPDATFLHDLASFTLYIVSARDIENGMNFNRETNGTGAFMLESWEPEGEYVFVRNPNYWQEGLPYLDRLIQIPFQDDQTRVNALISGEVDLIEYVPWQDFDYLESEFSLFTHESLYNGIRLNHNREPFDQKEVRQALNYIVDQQMALDLAFGGHGDIKSGPLQPAGSLYYQEELEGALLPDHEKAMELLAEAGYNSPAEVPPIEFTVAAIAVHSDTAEVVQEQLQAFGLTVNWRTVEVSTMIENRTSGAYVMQQDGLSMANPDPDYLRFLFHSTDGSNHSVGVGFENERLDELFEEGLKTIDFDERKAIYLEIEELLIEESPWIFLFWRPQAEAAHTKVQGYTTVPGGLGMYNLSRFNQIWIDDSVQ